MQRDDDWLRRLIEAKIDPDRHVDLELDWLWTQIDRRSDAVNAQWYMIEDTEPEAAWRLVEIAVTMNLPQPELETIGAGMFETLMQLHGPDFIDRVEAAAASSADMLTIVKASWATNMTPDVTARIEALQR